MSSLVTEEMYPKGWQAYHSTPMDREERKLHVLGNKLHSSSALGFKISNYETVMAGYQLFSWERLLPFLGLLPGDEQRLAEVLHIKTIKLSKQWSNAGQHSKDSAAHTMASSIVLRCHAWLRSTELPVQDQAKIKGLPFEGSLLFSTRTDEIKKISRCHCGCHNWSRDCLYEPWHSC